MIFVKKIISFKFYFLIIVLFVITYFQWFRCDDECFFNNAFSDVEGVNAVLKYFNYENHRFVNLDLVGNKNIQLSDFDESLFDDAYFVALYSIGDLNIKCVSPDGKHNYGNAFNLIEYVNNYSALPKVKNISEISASFDDIYSSIHGNIGGDKKMTFEFGYKYKGTGRHEVLCYTECAQSLCD